MSTELTNVAAIFEKIKLIYRQFMKTDELINTLLRSNILISTYRLVQKQLFFSIFTFSELSLVFFVTVNAYDMPVTMSELYCGNPS